MCVVKIEMMYDVKKLNYNFNIYIILVSYIIYIGPNQFDLHVLKVRPSCLGLFYVEETINFYIK